MVQMIWWGVKAYQILCCAISVAPIAKQAENGLQSRSSENGSYRLSWIGIDWLAWTGWYGLAGMDWLEWTSWHGLSLTIMDCHGLAGMDCH